MICCGCGALDSLVIGVCYYSWEGQFVPMIDCMCDALDAPMIGAYCYVWEEWFEHVMGCGHDSLATPIIVVCLLLDIGKEEESCSYNHGKKYLSHVTCPRYHYKVQLCHSMPREEDKL